MLVLVYSVERFKTTGARQVIRKLALFFAISFCGGPTFANECTVIAEEVFKLPLQDFLRVVHEYATSKNDKTRAPRSVRRAEIVGNGKRVIVNFWVVEETLGNHRDF